MQNEDERTRAMTKDEYVHYSECRQASFTYRKAKRFRDWVGMSNLIDSKPIPDLIDVLGFLTFEIVATLTEEAHKVKADMEKAGEEGGGPKKRRRLETGERFLFDGPDEQKTALSRGHVAEAFRRLQSQVVRTSRGHVMRNFAGGLVKTKVGLI
jgi:transcription initiation protein SPT3